MNDKLLRVIDLVAQLREAMREVDGCLYCDVSKTPDEDKAGVKGGYKSQVFLFKNVGLSEVEDFSETLNRCYTVVDGVKVSCLEEKQ